MADRTDVGTVEELHASATKLTGLDDFGADDDNYREALQVLLDSYQREANLTVLGSKMNRFFLRGALVARLLSESAWKQYPQYADVVIERPIFVTGLVRTGTTALHRLLGADPAHQGLHMWLAEFPQPRPPRETWDSNPLYRQLDTQFTQHHRTTPATPACISWPHTSWRNAGSYCGNRCIRSLTRRCRISRVRAVAVAAGLDAVISAAPQEPSADRTQRRRQAVGAEESQPSVCVDALMATYPDALVIQPHRPVETIMASMCSLAQHTAEGWSTTSSGPRSVLTQWKPGRVDWNGSTPHGPNTTRPSSTSRLQDLIADPMGTVADIYRHFGLTLTERLEQAMEEAHAESQSGERAPKHRYSLADYGLTVETVKEHFAGL